MELVEILLQIIAFIEICPGANLYYVISFQVTLLLNGVSVLTLHVFRDHFHWSDKTKRLVLIMVDSGMEIIYLFVNFHRGGEVYDSLSIGFFQNAAILFPCGMLLWKSKRQIQKEVAFFVGCLISDYIPQPMTLGRKIKRYLKTKGGVRSDNKVHFIVGTRKKELKI